MKKRIYIQALIAVLLISYIIVGCGIKNSYEKRKENHAAAKTYQEGKWKVRYDSRTWDYTDRIKSTTFFLSVNVEQELTKKEMLDIMDYYELTVNAHLDANNRYKGERESDYNCYAVFYNGNTDEEVDRIKYFNGEEVEIPEEEQSYFPKPNMNRGEQGIGEYSEENPLP